MISQILQCSHIFIFSWVFYYGYLIPGPKLKSGFHAVWEVCTVHRQSETRILVLENYVEFDRFSPVAGKRRMRSCPRTATTRGTA
jgi:hypothetical protein